MNPPDIEWRALWTTEQFAHALREILKFATEARNQGTEEDVNKAKEILLLYQDKTPGDLEHLDELAKEAVQGIAKDQKTAAIEALQKISKELGGNIQLLDKVTGELKASAEAVALKQIGEHLKGVKSAMETLKENSENLPQELKNIVGAIDTFLATLEADEEG